MRIAGSSARSAASGNQANFEVKVASSAPASSGKCRGPVTLPSTLDIERAALSNFAAAAGTKSPAHLIWSQGAHSNSAVTHIRL